MSGAKPVNLHATAERVSAFCAEGGVGAWVNRVCAVADPPPDWAWSFAEAYRRAAARQEDTGCLDRALTWRVWEWKRTDGGPEEAMDNQRHQETIREACQLASPTTWETQWHDLISFHSWPANANMLPPWADEEWEEEPPDTATSE